MGFATDLAQLIAALRHADTAGETFSGSGRGGDLASHDAYLDEVFRTSEGLLDVRRLREAWARFRVLPRTDRDVMTHGDLVPGNVTVADGRLVGVLDCGGYGPADPALDLVAAWHLLDTGPREVLRRKLGCDDLQWERGKAWAFHQAVGLVAYYLETNPPMSRLGVRTLTRVLETSRI